MNILSYFSGYGHSHDHEEIGKDENFEQRCKLHCLLFRWIGLLSILFSSYCWLDGHNRRRFSQLCRWSSYWSCFSKLGIDQELWIFELTDNWLPLKVLSRWAWVWFSPYSSTNCHMNLAILPSSSAPAWVWSRQCSGTWSRPSPASSDSSAGSTWRSQKTFSDWFWHTVGWSF